MFLDLGFTPPADAFLSPDRLNRPETWYPLKVLICNNCSLVQLNYVVSPRILFQKDYPYESSITKTGREHFHSLAKTAYSKFSLSSGDLVIDIGSNVGVLLQGFKNQGANVLGIDPAPNICEIARRNGIETINDFFNEKVASEIVKTRGKAKIITGTNVVAHIDDLHSLARAVDILLDKEGVFIIEAPYLVDLIEKLEYDTIYHEHLSYLSIKPLNVLFHKFRMEIFDVEKISIHGGSLRYFVTRKNTYPVSKNVHKFLKNEKKFYERDTLINFARNVERNREELTWMLKSLKHEGKCIAGLSAPAKGMTLLNYCKIGPDTIDFITEKSTLKIGKYTPGTHIPIVPDSELIKRMPNYVLLLAWNFADEIMNNLKDYEDAGGKFIIPIPRPRIVN
jgi:predicted RNA methylase